MIYRTPLVYARTLLKTWMEITGIQVLADFPMQLEKADVPVKLNPRASSCGAHLPDVLVDFVR